MQSGIHDCVLCVPYEKQGESNAIWALSISVPFSLAAVAGGGGYFAPLVRGYIQRSRAPEDTGIRVAVQDRQNALRNPLAHLRLEDISFELVANSPMRWGPIRYLETCPSSDGACALAMENESLASQHPNKVAWIHATEMKSEPTMFSGRDQVMPQATLDNAKSLYKKTGITKPRAGVDCAETYVPFSWFEPRGMEGRLISERNQGWKMTYEGAKALDGDFPVNMSGGVRWSNPIGACGLIRFAEAALQCGASPGTTRSTARTRRWGARMAGAPSTFRPGSSARTSPETATLPPIPPRSSVVWENVCTNHADICLLILGLVDRSPLSTSGLKPHHVLIEANFRVRSAIFSLIRFDS